MFENQNYNKGDSSLSSVTNDIGFSESLRQESEQEVVRYSHCTDAEPTALKRKAMYRAWLLLCFVTGPTASLFRTYVPALIQTVARILGKTSQGQRCSSKGNDCYVYLGSFLVHDTAYVHYTRALSTAIEAIVAIILMNIADYASFRKWLLLGSIILYGTCAIPFAALNDTNYPTLRTLSSLYIILTVDDIVYQILEGSYIPIFMRAGPPEGQVPEEVRRSIIMQRGSSISVMGIIAANLGGLAALVIGIIILCVHKDSLSYHSYLIAVSAAGSMTVIFSLFSFKYIPSVQGKKMPKNLSLLTLPIRRTIGLFKDIRKHPHAFMYCISWVIWNLSNANFMNLFMLLFRSTLGIGSSDIHFSVFTLTSYILACLGSLLWMYLYPRCKITIKTWGYLFLTFSVFSNFWGCLGIRNLSPIGFKNAPEYWIFIALYSSSSSAIRALNRTVYSTLLPVGNEAQYFGLEIILSVATSWLGAFLIAIIQDKSNNDRIPFLLNQGLVVISLLFYSRVDTEKGMLDVNKVTT